MKRITLALFLIISFALRSQTLDNTFNGNGIVKTEFNRYPDAMAPLSGSRTAVASQDWGSGSIYLIKYNEDGSLDQSFGSGGVATHVLSGKEMNGPLYLKALEGDRLLVTGCYYLPGTPMTRLFAARFNADGTVDQSFGTGGLAVNDTLTYDFGGACQSPSGKKYASYRGGTAQVDYAGRIVQGGTRTFKCDQEYQNQFYAVRYNADGSVDESFQFEPLGFPYTVYDVEAAAVHICEDSTMLLVAHGRGLGGDTLRRVPKIMQLQRDGTIGFDPAFSLNIADPSVEYFKVSCMAAVDSGYLLAGTIREGGRDKFAVTKIRKNFMQVSLHLNVDSSFGTNGRAVVDVSQTGCELRGITATQGGKVLIGGSAETNPITGSDMAMARLNENGILDESFGSGGILKKDHDSGTDYVFGLEASSDGKTVVLGSTEKAGELYIVLMRYADGLTSAPDEEEIAQIAVYPNPAADVLRVRLRRCSWEVKDMLGRVVMRGSNEEGDQGVDVSMLAAGPYVFSVTDKDIRGQVRFVKK